MVVISLCRLSSSAVRQCWPFPPISSNCTSSALTSKFPCLSCMYVGCFRFRKGFLMSMFLDIAQLQIAFDLRVDSCGATLALVFLSNGTLFGCPPDQTHTYFDCRVRLICNVHQGASHDWGRPCHHHCLQAHHYTGAEGGSRLKLFDACIIRDIFFRQW